MRDLIVYNKTHLHKSLVYAAKVLNSYKDEINKSNFFPVPDGDTGTNLSMMMQEFIQNESRFLSPTLSKETKDLNLFNNSRGTIGLIFYEYFREIIKTEKDHIDIFFLKELFKLGYLNVYKALPNPVEGTILSLMKVLYMTLEEKLNTKKDFISIIKICIEELEKELDKTRRNSKQIFKIDALDSGALAFYIFMDSFLNHLIDIKVERSKFKNYIENKKNLQTLKVNYDFTVLLTFKLVEENNPIFEKISSYSKVECISKIDNFYKVILHTNNLQELNNTIIHHINYEDIYIENLALKNKALISGGETCILSDSIADVPIYFNEKDHIFSMDLKIFINNSIFIDRRTIKNEYFYELMKDRKNKMETTAPSLMEAEYILNFLKTYYKNIIVITVSDKLSKTYQVINESSQKFTNTYVLNSKEASVSQGLLLQHAHELINKKIEIKTILELIKLSIENARMLMIADSVSNLNQSGRFKKSFGLFSKILNLYPVLSLDKQGNISHKTSSLNEEQAVKYIIHKIEKEHKEFGVITYGIAHADNLKVAERIRKELAFIIGKEPVYITNLSSVVTLHTGIGTCVVGYIKNELKKAL